MVGAHLSGMALNHELRALGGLFLRAVDTEPSYELYALPGGPPERPGLCGGGRPGTPSPPRCGRCRSEGFGRFVAGIPAPLGIGTLLLADGTRPKGFLCEAEASAPRGISPPIGGWRAFMAAKS